MLIFAAQNVVRLRLRGAGIRSVAVLSVGLFFILLLRNVVLRLVIWVGMIFELGLFCVFLCF
jgi:hypothetical protein